MNASGPKLPHISILAEKMGQGHMSVSRALATGLEQTFPGQYDIEITDISSLLGNPLLDQTMLKVHRHISRAFPLLYKYLFQLGNLMWLVRLINRLASPAVRTKIRAFITTAQPDIIISTFPTWNPLIARTYKSIYPQRKFIVIVTDLIYAHKAWIAAAEADTIVVGNPETQAHLEKFEPHKNRIQVLGYPTQPLLLQPIDRSAVLAKIGLDPQAFTVLYLVSIESADEVQATLSELETQFPNDNVIVAAGRNEALLAKLTTSRPHHSALIGWTDAMPDFLRACEIVLTKAGGATVMECMVAGKPMVISRAVTGEEGNAEIVQKYGYGLVLSNHEPKTISQAVATIKADHPAYTARLAEFPYRNATTQIARYINETLKATS